MKLLNCLWWSLFAVLPGQMLSAQESDGNAASQDAIVVTGEQQSNADTVRKGVKKIRPSSDPAIPIGRFKKPICLGFAGLEAGQEAVFRTIINFRANNVGLETPASDCQTNALIIIVNEPEVLIAALKKKQPRLMPYREYRRFEAAMKRGDPVFAWNRQEVAGAVVTTINVAASRIIMGKSAEVVNSIIIFDATKIGGLKFAQLADYAAMRLLAPSRVSVNWQSDYPRSILGLFSKDSASVTDTMTVFDESYLVALYDLPTHALPVRLKSEVLKAYYGKDEE